MGRAAGAVLTAVAPEAKLASKAAAHTGSRRRRPPVPDPRVTAPGSEAARTRQYAEDLKARRPAEPPTAPADPAPAPPPASPGGGPSLPTVAPSVQTGSGFVLGLFLWGWVGLPYLRGGAPEVRRTLAAKFLNKTSQGG